MKIFDQINKRDNTFLGDKDKVLKNRFIEGIKEPHLKREVKRFSYEHKTVKFLEFRQEVLLWVNEIHKVVKLQMQDAEVISNKAIKSEHTSKDNSEILKLLTKQGFLIHKPIICYDCGGKGHKRPECPSVFQAQRSDEDRKYLRVDSLEVEEEVIVVDITKEVTDIKVEELLFLVTQKR
ncbi:CNBP [Mytilus coruscus]|uniref:CNBP n=1 Tax=Mytilus coruscus TaxID=42192 RepID=A0A6J8D586_MYTCO|nr:CNBP [Mytilus coruscus]